MGHCSQIALGIAQKAPNKNIYCLDGDGALLMHMGALAIIGTRKVSNFTHIVINNGAHDSVGGQPTVGFDIDFTAIAKACGYNVAMPAETPEEIQKYLQMMKSSRQASFLEIRVNKGARKELGRPNATPAENRTRFMEILSA
jgi:phosphonopyruvate decarboxylase